MRSPFSLLLAAALPILTPAPAAAQNTIVDIVLAASGGSTAGQFDDDRSDYDLLITALQTADLVGALQDPDARLTVFAPSDAAFVRLARGLGFGGHDEAGAWQFLVTALTQLGNGDPIPVLTNVLLYHVSPQRLRAADVVRRTLRCQRIPTLLEGATIRPFFFTLIDNEPDLRNPRLTCPIDRRASNGIVHGLDRVLLPVDLP